MKDRTQRLRTVKKLIRASRIRSQEVLLTQLHNEGFMVTQATLSRDLKYLQVGKVAEGGEGYYYALPSDEERRENERNHIHDFLRGYLSIEFSSPVAILRTLTGHANSVAIALDCLHLDGLLGTIAGDDAVLLVLAENVQRNDFLQTLRDRIPGFEE
ncbi:arginine repressor [Spirochaeta dissipatitropha]